MASGRLKTPKSNWFRAATRHALPGLNEGTEPASSGAFWTYPKDLALDAIPDLVGGAHDKRKVRYLHPCIAQKIIISSDAGRTQRAFARR